MRCRDGAAREATREGIGDFAGGKPGPIPGRGTAEHPRRSVNARLDEPSLPSGVLRVTENVGVGGGGRTDDPKSATHCLRFQKMVRAFSNRSSSFMEMAFG